MSAPRKHLTPADIEAAIIDESIQGVEGTQIALCVLTMRNGARVVGINYGSIDPARQDWVQGGRLARENAIKKVWELEGYALRERLAAAPLVARATPEQVAELQEAIRNAPPSQALQLVDEGIPWTVLVEGDSTTLPTARGEYLVTVDTDSGRETHVLEFTSGKWLHEGEFTFQHGYYFRPIAWAPRPAGYDGEVPE